MDEPAREWRSPAQDKPRDVAGVGMMGTETCVTEGDLVRSAGCRLRSAEPFSEGESRRSGAHEESERFIVAMTPCESREQPRDRSRREKPIHCIARRQHREGASFTFGLVPKDETRAAPMGSSPSEPGMTSRNSCWDRIREKSSDTGRSFLDTTETPICRVLARKGYLVESRVREIRTHGSGRKEDGQPPPDRHPKAIQRPYGRP